MKIIASDFDGTVNYKGISQADAEAITRFREAGNKFGIVTGRDLEMAMWVLYDFEKANTKIDFLICCTGAVVLDGNGNVIKMKEGNVTQELREVIDKALELEVRSLNINYKLLKSYLAYDEKIPYELDLIKKFTQVNAWFPSEENAESFNQYVNSNFSHIISAYRNGGSIDMPPANTSKVTGVYDYASQFDNPEIYTVGDNLNDLPMIREFCGFAVSNAHPEVKNVAKHQCDRVCDMINYLMENE